MESVPFKLIVNLNVDLSLLPENVYYLNINLFLRKQYFSFALKVLPEDMSSQSTSSSSLE